ncbi:BTB/POZ domain-containing protein [Xylaria grammica]|nr:BTB/POZ domain-containing protein [Xylaria grammica]
MAKKKKKNTEFFRSVITASSALLAVPLDENSLPTGGAGYFPSSSAYGEPEMDDSRRSLVLWIAKLFNNPDHADVKIYIGEHELPAHSVVLASQSQFFQTALTGNFKEGKAKQFHFKEGSAHAHWRVFEHMYTGNYSEEPAQALDAPDDDELLKDVRVYATAEFFMLDDVKRLALERFMEKLKHLWVSELLVGCIREVYASTTQPKDRLRSVVVDIVHDYRSTLWQRKAFQDLVYEGGDFAVDLMGRCIEE